MRHLEQSLKEYFSSVKILEEKTLLLNDEVVATPSQHFEKAKRHIGFFYPKLNLSKMDPFQVVQDGQMVDED